jgi:hypothetical protein
MTETCESDNMSCHGYLMLPMTRTRGCHVPGYAGRFLLLTALAAAALAVA